MSDQNMLIAVITISQLVNYTNYLFELWSVEDDIKFLKPRDRYFHETKHNALSKEAVKVRSFSIFLIIYAKKYWQLLNNYPLNQFISSL